MNTIQERILELIDTQDIGKLSLREIAKIIDEKYAQSIKHHLDQLQKKGLIFVDRENGIISKTKTGINTSKLFSIPIMGTANCGTATSIADNEVQGYLKISKSLLKKDHDIYALKAKGNSMNDAKIGGKDNIENGDYLIVSRIYKNYKTGDYVVSIIDGCANIKRLYKDTKNKQIILFSESKEDFPPIYISESDVDSYLISGEVIQVIKSPII